VAAEGRGSFVMPGLAPGAFIEVAYRTDSSRAQGGPFRGESFYFQDVQMQSPFILSRWALLLPPDLDLGLLEWAVGGDGRPRPGRARGPAAEDPTARKHGVRDGRAF